MNEQVVVKAWGNSQGIRIPKGILKKLGIGVEDTLNIETDGEAIIMKKVFKHKTFEERLAEYDGRIELADFDWGEPKGRELL